jgi:hypothetical protein
MEILRRQYKTLQWSDKWAAAFGNPEPRGVWFVWGNTGNGKSSFLMQLVRELALFGKVFYNSLEEGTGLTMRNQLLRSGISDVSRNVLIGNESVEEIDHRLTVRKSPRFIFIDSFQYFGANFIQFKKLTEKHPDKLFIVVSHAEGKLPTGRPANAVRFYADLKIWVEGFKAISNGRYNPGGEYVIWAEGAEKYYGTKTTQHHEV